MSSAEGIQKAPEYLKRIHVLVVDNDKKITAIIANVLKCFGFRNIYQAQDGFAAVDVMRENEVDLIITDWRLLPVSQKGKYDIYHLPSNPVVRSDQWSPAPPVDGASFVRYVRMSKYSPAPFVPVIMFIGLGIKDNIEYARDAGVNEIILKPFSIEDLCDRIRLIIDNPRCFVTSKKYKGPCRRREQLPLPKGMKERRKLDVILFKHSA